MLLFNNLQCQGGFFNRQLWHQLKHGDDHKCTIIHITNTLVARRYCNTSDECSFCLRISFMMQAVCLPSITELHYDRRRVHTAFQHFPFQLKSAANLASICIRFTSRDRTLDQTPDYIAQWSDHAQFPAARLSKLEVKDPSFDICYDSLRHLVNLEILRVSTYWDLPKDRLSLLSPFTHLSR